ncbi:unnamed protein product, partial [Chrysoparadoxa australica]
SSPWAFPVVAVPKADGTVRITCNYKKLNDVTIVPKRPIPLVEDLLNQLGGAKHFSVGDLTSGFFTCVLADESIPLTAMITSFGLFEYLRCPQGVSGAPGGFSRMMSIVMAGIENVQVFIDDCLMYTATVDEHLKTLEEVFDRMKDHGIKISPKKMVIGASETKFLGHVITREGVKVDPDKVKALEDMKVPENLSQLRSFLGLASYYRRFV